MRKVFTLIIIFSLSLFYSEIKAQIIQGEAIFGMNLSKVEGDRVNNGLVRFNKPGVNLGLGAIVPIAKNWGVNLEVLFTQKGAYKRKGPYVDSLEPYYKTALNYAEVPVIVQYTDPKGGLTIGTGLSYSRLVGAKWIVNGNTYTKSINDGYFSRDNLDWLMDFRIKLYKQLKLNIRYQYSLTSIWSGPDDALLETLAGEKQSSDQRNSMISIRVIWIFNEAQSKRNLNQ